MELWIARHGPNDLGGPEALDRERSLTERGALHVQAVAERMKRDGEIPNIVFASPFARTMETADIFGQAFGRRVVPSTDLCPWHPLLPYVAQFMPEFSGIMMVGHHSSFEALLKNIGDGAAPEVLACGEVRRYSVMLCETGWKMCLRYRVTPADVGMGDMIA